MYLLTHLVMPFKTSTALHHMPQCQQHFLYFMKLCKVKGGGEVKKFEGLQRHC